MLEEWAEVLNGLESCCIICTLSNTPRDVSLRSVRVCILGSLLGVLWGGCWTRKNRWEVEGRSGKNGVVMLLAWW